LRTVRAHCRGEPRVVRIVRVPSPEQEDVRRGSRERERLSKEQTAHTNRIKALLRTLGLAAGNPRRRDWLKWLAEQRDWQGQPVPPHYLAELKREHARLLLVGEQLGELSGGGEPTDVPAAAAGVAGEETRLRPRQTFGPGVSGDPADDGVYNGFDHG